MRYCNFGLEFSLDLKLCGSLELGKERKLPKFETERSLEVEGETYFSLKILRGIHMMASQDSLILNLLQTVLEVLKVLCAEFKLHNSSSIAAQYEIRKLKLSQKSFEKIMVDISEHVDDIQEKVGSQASTVVTSGLHEVVESLKVKMKSYAEATKSAHLFLSRARN